MSTKPVIARMDELLKPLGFARHKAIWNRQSDCFIDVIDVQTSKSGDMMTINAGVFHPEVHRKCWATELPAIIQEPQCIVRARIGQLIGSKDLWWQLNDHGIVNDVAEKLAAHVMPFLERMHSLAAMDQFLTSLQTVKRRYSLEMIYLAIIKHERGDTSGACALLHEPRQKAGVWQTKIGEVVERLGCS